MERIYLQALGVWVLFVILAIVNGTLRSKVYGPAVESELRAHQISTVIAVLLFLATMYLFFAKTNAPYTERDLLVIGLMWLALTIVFEFGFQRYVMGAPWSTRHCCTITTFWKECAVASRVAHHPRGPVCCRQISARTVTVTEPA